MVNINTNIKKVCSLYASEWHLVTMLLPHINKSINEKVKITTILEKDTQEKVQTLLSKLRLANEKQILQIGWTNKKNIKDIDINKIVEITNNEKLELIICGTSTYIDKVNDLINKETSEHNIKNKLIIINCYSAEEKNLNIRKILQNHETILNTAGEKDSEQFMQELNIVS